MLQPTVSFEKGFCNYDCTLCSEVCPTGAIKLLTKDLKQKTQIGHAVFIEENCIVNRHHTDCGACAEHCPTQAVSMQPYKDGLSIPHVDASICVGCGGCEFACPAKPFKAIHIEGHLSQTQRAEFKETKQSVQQVDSFGF
jgi:ferredoxin